MALEDVKKEYAKIVAAVKTLQDALDVSYFDALIETADNLAAGEVHVEDGQPDEKIQHQLLEQYQEIHLDLFSRDEARQLLQLLILNAYREERVQANHQMTPDTVGILVEYVIEKIIPHKDLRVLDIAVGTGNLLMTIVNRLQDGSDHQIAAYGVDNDDTQLALADVMAEWEQASVELIHQDAISQLMVPQADLVIGDLPVGYYPVDGRAATYETKESEGHSYVHYLMIEQAFRTLVPGGLGVFVVPANLFSDEHSQRLLKYIKKVGYLQGMLGLPVDLFRTEAARKAILIVQKRGENAKQAPQVLLGDFPSFKDKEEFHKFLNSITQWERKSFTK